MSVYDKNKTLIFTGGTVATGGASSGDLAAEIAAREAGDNALAANIGKIFQSRQQAVDAGQENLPGSYGIILTLENGDLVFRRGGATADALFPTVPRWGVYLRVASQGVQGFNTDAAILSYSPPPGLNTIIIRNLAVTSIWRKLGSEPVPVDPEIHRQDALSGWWERTWTTAGSDAGWQAAIDAEEAARIAADDAEAEARADGDAALQAQIDDVSGTAYPGNKIIAISNDPEGKPTTGVTADTGRLWSPQGVDMSDGEAIPYPGNSIYVLYESKEHVPIFGIDLKTNRPWFLGSTLDAPMYPGNSLIVLVDDQAGNPVIAWDTANNALWLAGSTEGGGTGGGSTVEFVDPLTGVQPYMAIKSGTATRYMDGVKWPGRMIGFEERTIDQLPVTIAQTPDPALGIVAFGGGTTYVQTPGNDYPWHILNSGLSEASDDLEAQRAANEFLTVRDSTNDTLFSIFALSEPVSSTVESDALPGSPARQSIAAKVTAAQASAQAFGKRLYIDRIHLSLLEGQPSISQPAADLHYAGVAQDMANELATIAEQGALPVTVITQSFGSRDNGVSNVALAEGRLHWNHWSLNIVCATPRYPFPLVPGSPALHTELAALQIAELQNVAALTKLNGQNWYPPSLEQATIAGNVITARFSSMDDTIVIRDALNHGFTIDGDSAGAVITDVSVSGVLATITLDTAPVDSGSGLFLNYAYGQTGDPGDGFAANRGSITDSWSMESRHGGTLYRYALSNRVAISAE